MDQSTTVVESKPEQRSGQPQPPSDSEARYQRRAALLGNPRAKLSLFLVIALLLAAGVLLWRYFGSYESTDDAQIDGHINAVSARVSGHVLKLNVEDNQYVEKGTVLVEVDPTDYEVAVARARADYADAQAQAAAAGINVPLTNVSTSSQVAGTQAGVANAKAGIAGARQQLAAAQAQVVEAEANNVKVQNDLARYQQLIDKQEISQQQYDQAVAAAKASAAGLEAVRAAADAAAAQVEQAQGRLLQASADLRTAETAPQMMQATRSRARSAQANADRKKADLQQAELNLQYTKIVAPVSGVVTKNVELGMNVQPGQQLVSIVPLDDIWITANFKETQLKKMKPGQRAEIKADSNGRTYQGRVDSISGSSGARMSLLPPENATGNYVKVVQRVPVKIVLNSGQNADHSLRLGMSVEPKVFLK